MRCDGRTWAVAPFCNSFRLFGAGAERVPPERREGLNGQKRGRKERTPKGQGSSLIGRFDYSSSQARKMDHFPMCLRREVNAVMSPKFALLVWQTWGPTTPYSLEEKRKRRGGAPTVAQRRKGKIRIGPAYGNGPNSIMRTSPAYGCGSGSDQIQPSLWVRV